MLVMCAQSPVFTEVVLVAYIIVQLSSGGSFQLHVQALAVLTSYRNIKFLKEPSIMYIVLVI